MNNLLTQAINSFFSYVGFIFVTENTLSEETGYIYSVLPQVNKVLKDHIF